MQLRETIEEGAKRAGSHALLARSLGISIQQLSNFKAGKPCSLHMQARICAAAGMDEAQQMRFVWEVVRDRMGQESRRGILARSAKRKGRKRRMCGVCGGKW